MILDSRITSLSFNLANYITIKGIVWGGITTDRIINNNANSFRLDWFWPKEAESLIAILTEVHNHVQIIMQEKKAIPKEWPIGLGAEPNDYPMNFVQKEIYINSYDFPERNPKRSSMEHLPCHVKYHIMSSMHIHDNPHCGDNYIESIIPFSLPDAFTKRIFTVITDSVTFTNFNN